MKLASLGLGLLLSIVAVAATADRAAAPAAYDPMRVEAAASAAPLDLSVTDPTRRREIPLRVWLPRDAHPAPVIVFSHGLGGSREGYSQFAQQWAARGYAVVHPQHAGSDDAVWKDVRRADRLDALRSAANVSNFVARAEDVPAVLDALARWNDDPGHPLHGRLDLSRVGMAGHSFGAVTSRQCRGNRSRSSARATRIRASAPRCR
jgi:predicted dienelactone hydrolase